MSKKTLLYVILALFCCSTLIVIGSTRSNTPKYVSPQIEEITQSIQTIEGLISRDLATPADLEKLARLHEALAEAQNPARSQAPSQAESEEISKQVNREEAEYEASIASRADEEELAKLAAEKEIRARQAAEQEANRANAILVGTAVNRDADEAENEAVPEKLDPVKLQYKALLNQLEEAKAAGDEATALRVAAELETFELPEAQAPMKIRKPARLDRITTHNLDQGGETCATATVIGALPYNVTGCTHGTTNDCGVGTYNRPFFDTFFEFTVPATGIYNFNMYLSAGDTYMKLWVDGTCCAGDTLYNDDGAGDADPEIETCLLENQVVYVECGTYSSTTNPGTYNFNLSYVDVCPTGRCCYYDGVDHCADDYVEPECDAVNGDWLEGETCATSPCPTGRCCYNGGVDCADDLSEVACLALDANADWLEDGTCATDPCFICTPHHTLTDEGTIVDANGTCGDGNNLGDGRCVGYYDSGEENIIEWTVTVSGLYTVSLTSVTTWTCVAITTECEALNCIAVASSSTGGTKTIPCTYLDAGTYYIYVDTWSTPFCMTEYTVTTAFCPVGRCCYGTPEAVLCADEIESDCLARTNDLGWDETLTCGTDPCDDLGRCCYGNPSAPDCADENQFACLARTDELSWDGDLDCTTACPVINGRCCYGDETEPGFTGYDCADETEYECIARTDYISWDSELDCTTPCPLPPVGRCCYGELHAPSCVDEYEALCNLRTDMISWDELLTCGTDPCPIPPTGRCCYGDAWTVSCEDEIEAYCLDRTDYISWDETMDCTNNPCEPVCDYPIEAVAATCETAILLTPPVARAGDIADGDFLPTGFPYCGTSASGHVAWYKVIGTGNTMTVNFCDDCNIYFDSIIRVYACACDVDYIHCVGGADYVTCDPLTDAVHPGGYTWCTNAGEEYYIVAGAYYSSDVEGEFVIHLTDDGTPCTPGVGCPVGRCCYLDEFDAPQCADNTEQACDLLGGDWTSGLNCAEDPCPTGRCCYGDPQAPSCADETELECLARADAQTWDEGELCAYQGVVVNVAVTDNAFVPADIVVYQGDQVVWTWDAGNVNLHNVVSDDAVTFDSGDPTLPPAVFNHTFTDAPGVYTYSCENYGGDPDFMVGSVEVVAAPLNTCAVIIGRCCYGDPYDQSCADETVYECMARPDDFSWDETEVCGDPDGCPDFVLGQNCFVPYLVTVGVATPYLSPVLTTENMVDDCGRTGADIFFEVTVEDDADYTFSLCNPGTEALDDYLTVYSESCCGVIEGYNDSGPTCSYTSYANAQITCLTLTAGTYWVNVEHYFASRDTGMVQLSIDACIGRCCYDDVFDPTCVDNIGPGACEALGTGSTGGYWNWDIGLDCGTACPVPEPGDLCENQIVVNPPYDFTWDMSLYDGNCSYYDHDIFFEIVIDHAGLYTISLCNPGSTAPGYAYMSLRSNGCCGSSYLYPTTTTCGNYREYQCYSMAAGSYYLIVYQYTSAIGQLELTVEECLDWRCCYGDPFDYGCDNTTDAGCAALGGVWTEFVTCESDPCVNCTEAVDNDDCSDLIGTCPVLVTDVPMIFSGNNTCAYWENDCLYDPEVPEDTNRVVWECFEITECSDVTISYCGSDAMGAGYVYIVVMQDCECSEYFFDDPDLRDWTTCGDPNSNPIMYWNGLRPGVYYHPVNQDRGPNYQIEITATAASLGRCCYGDPIDLTCVDNINKCDCDDLGGQWIGGVTCETSPCPPPCPILLSEYTNYSIGSWDFNDTTPADVTITVTDDYTIADVNVGIDVVHTWDGDITVTLESPLGTIVELTSVNGGSGDNYECTVFDMEAATAITAGSAPFDGAYIPEGDLSTLNGENTVGDWILHFSDGAGGDDGIVYSVAVELIPTAGCDPVTDLAIFYDVANLEFDLTWTNPQEATYKVWSTDDPNLAVDPPAAGWEEEANLGVLPAGPASTSILWADLPTNYANIVVTAEGCPSPVILGRCCYDDGIGDPPDCANNTADACALLSGEWTRYLNCEDYPCPLPPVEVGQGGETCASATVIPSFPAVCSGTTVGYANDLDASTMGCYATSTAPEVCYEFTPATTIIADLSLCGGVTNYDTKLYILENSVLMTCSDDDCSNPPIYTSNYISELPGVAFTAGNTYCIVVDGYSSYSGDYTLSITLP